MYDLYIFQFKWFIFHFFLHFHFNHCIDTPFLQRFKNSHQKHRARGVFKGVRREPINHFSIFISLHVLYFSALASLYNTFKYATADTYMTL